MCEINAIPAAHLQAAHEVPWVLVEFLQKILDDNPSITAIGLYPARLGWGMVQDIVLETPAEMIRRRVYGIAPIEACFDIKRDGGRCEFIPAA